MVTEYLKYLNDNKFNDSIKFSIREGTFPGINKTDNFLLICTGTGIAPLRFFLWRCYENLHSGKILLYYGCRNKNKDFLYHEEYEIFKNKLK